jgi:hypothetical protein
MSEWTLKALRKFEDFQAEYEGSIPFTRSTIFYATLRSSAIWHAFMRASPRRRSGAPIEINLS